jgi:hypothetical protein
LRHVLTSCRLLLLLELLLCPDLAAGELLLLERNTAAAAADGHAAAAAADWLELCEVGLELNIVQPAVGLLLRELRAVLTGYRLLLEL